jgi:excisionase family DNA binding protein
MNDAVMQRYAEYLQETGDKAAAASLTLAAVMAETGQPGVQPSRALTVAEAAERLRISQDTVYALVAKGELPHHRIGKGRSIRFSTDDLAEYERRMAEATRRPLIARRPNRL